MKFLRHISLLALPLLPILLFSCRNSTTPESFRWPAITPEADSLSRSLDRAFFSFQPLDSIAPSVRRLERLALRADAPSQLRARAAYFRARLLMLGGESERARQIMDSTLAATDSAASPYLYMRLKYQLDDYDSRTFHDYLRLTEMLAFYEREQDCFMTAALNMNAGSFLKDIGRSDEALDYYAKADSLYLAAGFRSVALRNRVNRASALFNSGDSISARRLLRSLLNDSIIRGDRNMLGIIYHNLFAYDGDTTALRHLYELEGEQSQSTTLAYFAGMRLREGEAAEALHLARLALETGTQEEDADGVAFALYAMADAQAALQHPDSAYYYLNEAVQLNNEIDEAKAPQITALADTDRNIARHKADLELRHSRRLTWITGIFSLLFILIVIAAWLLRHRLMRARVERMEDKLRQEKMQRRLMATGILLEEKEAVIHSVHRELRDLAIQGKMTPETGRIASPLQAHHGATPGRDAFMDMFAELHPEFDTRLRRHCPELTDVDMRLARYIAIGLTGKQLAATLGIRPASVKQARWRLRSKLGLSSSQSLEEALARFT